ncbi:MAG: hypothetical protein AAF919_07360 [Pseudomonadota bacterium]
MPYLSLLSDLILVLATIGVAIYARGVGRRVRRLADLDDGLGAAVKDLSDHVDKLTALHGEIRSAVEAEAPRLTALTSQADERIGRMELLLASLEDTDPSLPPRTSAPGEDGALPRFQRSNRDLSEELA